MPIKTLRRRLGVWQRLVILCIEITKQKEPSDELLEAIREVRNGEVERYENFEDFKKAMLDEVSH